MLRAKRSNYTDNVPAIRPVCSWRGRHYKMSSSFLDAVHRRRYDTPSSAEDNRPSHSWSSRARALASESACEHATTPAHRHPNALPFMDDAAPQED